MKSITITKAIEILREDLYVNAQSIDELYHLNRNNRTAEVYLGEDVLLYASQYHAEDPIAIVVIPLQKTWDWKNTLDFLQSRWERMNILVQMIHLPDAEKEAVKQAYHAVCPFRKVYTSLVMRQENAGKAHPAVRLMKKEDRVLFGSMQWEPVQYRPEPDKLFEVFVERGAGNILAYVEDGEILGYLSYDNLFENWYGIDYVYVIPDRTNQGIGTALLETYADMVQRDGGIATYANPAAEVSAHLVEKTGFTLQEVKYRFSHD